MGHGFERARARVCVCVCVGGGGGGREMLTFFSVPAFTFQQPTVHYTVWLWLTTAIARRLADSCRDIRSLSLLGQALSGRGTSFMLRSMNCRRRKPTTARQSLVLLLAAHQLSAKPERVTA